MNKASRLIKRYIALILVLLFSIESFAAVVGDNDGAAFITKAEFDSMRNNFQSQLDRYNSSIDNKIDGAIATYLAGVGVQSQREVKPIINNYTKIMWQPNWKIFGRLRQFTSETDYTDTLDTWFVPPADHRILTSENRFSLWDWQNFEYITVGLGLWGQPQKYAGGWMTTHGSYQWPQVFALLAVEDSAHGVPVLDPDEPFVSANNLKPFLVSSFKNRNVTGSYDYQVGYNPQYLVLTEVKPLSMNDGDAYALEWSAARNGNNGAIAVFTGRDSVNNTKLGLEWDTAFWTSITNWTQLPKNGYGSYASLRDPSTFNQDPWGVSIVEPSVTYQQQLYDAASFMLLGNDVVAKANYIQPTGERHSTGRCFTPGSETADVPVKWTRAVAHNLNAMQLNQSDMYLDPNIETVVSLPKLPQATISEIKSFHFKDGNTNLKLGQGIPLIKSVDTNGFLQLSFEFDVNYILDGSSKDKNLWLDIKKTDFLSKKEDYALGYIGIVDPDKTSKVPVSLKRLSYTNTDADRGKVSLTIPLEKEESLWLRIAPKNETGGHYAKMKNLKMTFVTK